PFAAPVVLFAVVALLEPPALLDVSAGAVFAVLLPDAVVEGVEVLVAESDAGVVVEPFDVLGAVVEPFDVLGAVWAGASGFVVAGVLPAAVVPVGAGLVVVAPVV